MALCDVCARPTGGEVVSDADFRKAVRSGYDPFRMGLSGPTLEQIATMSQIEGTDPYDAWRKRIAGQTMSEWQVCNGCLPALRPFLERKRSQPTAPTGAGACSKCGGSNPASQWHCSHCGHIQWGLIVFAFVVGLGLILWAARISNWLGTGITAVLAILFLWIGVTSIRDGLRARRHL
ncbi:MAG: hypothetical protein MUP76_07970 [Acidimicrobiia bacterium]|nr:hypothetical protein [Acidimicrobiia bacterium]